MPLMNDLLTRLKEDPPDTEMDLRAILDDTGYDLVAKESGSEGEGEYVPEGMEEEEEEVAQDESAEGEAEAEVSSEDPMAMMKELMPPGMAPPSENENPRMKVRRMTMVAAHKALPKDKKGRG